MKKSFIDEAILNAEKSTLNVANHGAVVIFRGKVVGRGYNKFCVENINKINRWSVHAEVDAINNALHKISFDDLKKSSLIVVRKMKDGNSGLSAPCKCCSNYIKKCGIKKCYYS